MCWFISTALLTIGAMIIVFGVACLVAAVLMRFYDST